MRNLAVLLACCAALAANAHDSKQSTDQLTLDAGSVVTLKVKDETTVRFLQDHFDVWLARSDESGAGTLDVWVDVEDQVELARLGFSYVTNELLSENLRELTQLQRASGSSSLRSIPSFSCYRTVEETHASLDQLAVRYPNLARVRNFGSSYLQSTGQGGYALKALVIENTLVPAPGPEAKPSLLLIAAIHAREYATAEIATRFAESLLANYQSDANTRWLLDTRRVIVVPIANPDGRKIAEGGVSQRRNLRPGTCGTATGVSGVDLNRNSSFFWGGSGASTDGCSDTFRGATAASEPETQALQALIAESFIDARGPTASDAAPATTSGMFISLHSFANIVLFPWGATNMAAPNRTGLQTLARKFGFYTNYQACQPPVSGCLYAASGTTDDQSYGELGVASFTFEVGNTGFFEACSSFEASTYPKNLSALNFAVQALRRPYLEPAGPEILAASARRNVQIDDGLLSISAVANDTRSFGGAAVSDPAHAIAQVSVFLNDPGQSSAASGLAMIASDGGFNTSVEAVELQLPLSVIGSADRIWIRALDANAQTGPAIAVAIRNASEFTNGFE
jgi:carboxypeptidase T